MFFSPHLTTCRKRNSANVRNCRMVHTLSLPLCPYAYVFVFDFVPIDFISLTIYFDPWICPRIVLDANDVCLTCFVVWLCGQFLMFFLVLRFVVCMVPLYRRPCIPVVLETGALVQVRGRGKEGGGGRSRQLKHCRTSNVLPVLPVAVAVLVTCYKAISTYIAVSITQT